MKLWERLSWWESHGVMVSRLFTGTFWNACASVLNQGGVFLALLLPARILGPDDFGHYAVVLATLTSIGVLAQTGLALAATKYIAEFRSTDPQRTNRILGLCSVLGPWLAAAFAAAVVVFAPFAARSLFGSASLALPAAAGAIYVFFFAAYSYPSGALTALESYRAMVLPAGISAVVTVAAVSAGARYGGVTGAIGGLGLAAGVRWYLHRGALRRVLSTAGLAEDLRGMWQEAPLLYNFGLPATLGGWLMTPAVWISNAWLVQLPDGYVQMANFAAAQSLRMVAMFVPQLLNGVGLAILNNVRSVRRSHSVVLRLNQISLVVCTALAALTVAIIGRPVMQLFGSHFAGEATSVLGILLISAVVESLSLGWFQAVQSSGRMWLALGTMTLPWQGTFIAAAYVLVPRWGAAGLAGAYLAGISAALVAVIFTAGYIGRSEKQHAGAISVHPFVSKIRGLLKWPHAQYRLRRDPVGYARSIGVTLGEGSQIYGSDARTFGREPYLITLGKNCHVGQGVRFITHEGLAVVLRGRYPDVEFAAPIEVGNNVAIGMRSIILPGVKVGDNCIIGCASMVNRDLPDNSIAAGVPARVLGSVEDWEPKAPVRRVYTGIPSSKTTRSQGKELFAVRQAGG